MCVHRLFVFSLVFYAICIFPHPLSFSLLAFENETSEGDKTFCYLRVDQVCACGRGKEMEAGNG